MCCSFLSLQAAETNAGEGLPLPFCCHSLSQPLCFSLDFSVSLSVGRIRSVFKRLWQRRGVGSLATKGEVHEDVAWSLVSAAVRIECFIYGDTESEEVEK